VLVAAHRSFVRFCSQIVPKCLETGARRCSLLRKLFALGASTLMRNARSRTDRASLV
jgi:hypothetical protein